MVSDAMLWRRLDVPGHDACCLASTDHGWCLDGAAVFWQEGEPACIAYRVACDAGWRTQEGTVQGWVGAHQIDFRVVRTASGAWTLNGEVVPHLDGCVDLDLGFTPATNLYQLRRVALRIGQAVDVPVVWLDVFAGTLNVLHQRYERRTKSAYWYEAPQFDYAALLEVRPIGFICHYPDLWEAEP